MKLAVVIYAHNQESLIGELVHGLVQKEITVFVVNDCSNDLTGLNARITGAWVINTKSKIGKCRGLLKAFNIAVDLDYFDYIATMELNDQINSLFVLRDLMPTNDLVIGTSKFSLAKKLSSHLLNLAIKSDFKDWFSEYRIYRTNLIQELLKYSDSYTNNINIEMLAKAYSLGATISEYQIGHTSKEFFSYQETFKTWLSLFKYPKRPSYNTSGDLW